MDYDSIEEVFATVPVHKNDASLICNIETCHAWKESILTNCDTIDNHCNIFKYVNKCKVYQEKNKNNKRR